MVLVAGFALAGLAAVLLGIGGDAWPSPWRRGMTITMIVGFVGVFAPIFLRHVLFLAVAAVHIFRVRILRHDLSPPPEHDDCWPFASHEQLEQVRAGH